MVHLPNFLCRSLFARLSQGLYSHSRRAEKSLCFPWSRRYTNGPTRRGAVAWRTCYALLAQITYSHRYIQSFLKNLSKHHVLSDGLPIYRRLQSDDQDSVRLLTVEDLIVIAQQLTPSEVKEQLLKQIRHSVADKSWRVRYMAATHFNEVRYNEITLMTTTDRLSVLACRGGWRRVGQRGVDRAICSTLERQRGRSAYRRCWSDSGYRHPS